MRLLFRWVNTIKKSLGFRLILMAIFALSIVELVFYHHFKADKELIVAQMKLEAYRLNDVLLRGILTDMIEYRKHSLQETLELIGQREDVLKVRVIEQGRIKISSDKSEIDMEIDQKEEACYDCHKGDYIKPLTMLRHRLFKDQAGNGYLGVVNPIYKQKICEECHKEDTNVLGVLDIVLSTDKVDRQLQAHLRKSIIIIITVLFFLACGMGVFIVVGINRPIKKLIEGTQHIMNNDFDYHIDIDSDDEIGVLARSFNSMTDQLKNFKEEIRKWNNELEQRIHLATTKLQDTNMKLEIANNKLRESDNKKSEVVMTVAHDLKAPLAAINNCLRVVLQGYLKGDRGKEQEMIKRADNRVNEMVQFVKELLDFSRMENEAKHMSTINLSSIIREVIDIYTHSAKEKGLSLIVEDLPQINIHGNRELLSSVFRNLVGNAIKYNSSNTHVWIKIDINDEDVKIQVGDNGIGMPEDEVPYIFDMLFRCSQTKRNKQEGNGLGLSIVKKAIELHEGNIHVKSKENEGTVFFITFPLSRLREEDSMGDEILTACNASVKISL
ncbi:MAG: ATP-binding protein [bacterium]